MTNVGLDFDLEKWALNIKTEFGITNKQAKKTRICIKKVKF